MQEQISREQLELYMEMFQMFDKLDYHCHHHHHHHHSNCYAASTRHNFFKALRTLKVLGRVPLEGAKLSLSEYLGMLWWEEVGAGVGFNH